MKSFYKTVFATNIIIIFSEKLSVYTSFHTFFPVVKNLNIFQQRKKIAKTPLSMIRQTAQTITLMNLKYHLVCEMSFCNPFRQIQHMAK